MTLTRGCGFAFLSILFSLDCDPVCLSVCQPNIKYVRQDNLFRPTLTKLVGPCITLQFAPGLKRDIRTTGT